MSHKYNPDGSLGSSWHSWVDGDKIQLPIQEDETALVLDALWKHYDKYGDDDLMIEKMYKKFIIIAFLFVCVFVGHQTFLYFYFLFPCTNRISTFLSFPPVDEVV